MSGTRFIDTHHHLLLPEYQQALIRAGAGDPSRPLRRGDDATTVLTKMAELGIDAAVVNPLSVAGVHHGNDAHARYLTESVNEAQAKFVAAAPDRLGFFATLPLPDIDGALTQMEHALDRLGADGVIFLSHQNGTHIGDPSFAPLYAEMNRRGVIAFIHPTVPPGVEQLNLRLWPSFIEYAFETTRVATNLIYHGIMRDYPDIKWIMAHAGGTLPFLSMRVRLIEELEVGRSPPFPFCGAGAPFTERIPEGVVPYLDRFYFDTALSGARAPMAALTEMARPDHIFYGSDWPFVAREFVEEQNENLQTMPYFAGDRFGRMERSNAVGLFKRFAGR
jgi:predicted TIM-barrel fold metal-dependent hydrolase